MSQDNKKSFVMYQGDGSNNVFSVPMTKGKYGTISVAFVRRGLDQYEYNPDTWGLNGGLFAWDLSGAKVYTDTATPAIGATIYDQYGVDTGDTVTAVGGATITVNTNVYTRDTLHDVDENTVLTWTGDTLQVGDYIVIERTTTRTQPFEFQNNQKHIEKSDDNLERQIQEVADKVDNALLVDPTHTIDSNKMNPVEWMKTILRSVDKSVRGFRYLNGWLDYSLDDPNIADVDKTWTHLVNTDNIKAIREQSRIENNETIYYTEYLAQDGSWKTLSDPHKWDNMKLSDLADTDFTNLSAGNFIMFDGLKWKNVYSSATASWGTLIGDITAQSDLMAKFTEYVRTDGTSIMTQPLLMRATDDFKCAIAPYWDGIGFFKLNDNNSVTLMASIEYNSGFEPATTNTYNIGASARKWKNLYLSGKAFMSVINNGYDIAIPVTNSADTFALLSDIAFKSTDVEITSLSNGDFLMFDGTKWVNASTTQANTDLSNLTPTGEAKFTAKANTDMDNLTATGANISNWSSNVTNCITEIPQDINLELSAGTLTLKAGSKCCLPDGSVYENDSDIVLDNATLSGSNTWLICNIGGTTIFPRLLSNCVSGAGATTTAGYAYNTTTNKITWYNAGGIAQDDTCSLPIAIITTSNGTITSINQVFNGFGYIGSTVFVVPGVKALKPNGRNSDGTLKNTEITISSVLTNTNTTGNTKAACLGLSTSSIDYTHSYKYDQASNTNNYDIVMVGEIDMSSGTITAIRPKQVFHALDYNDKDYIVTQVMPDYSSRISTGLTGSPTSATTASYTCPTNGWIQLKADRSSAGYTLFLYVNGVEQLNFPAYSASFVVLMYPVKSGDVILLKTDNASATWVVNKCDFLPCIGG